MSFYVGLLCGASIAYAHIFVAWVLRDGRQRRPSQVAAWRRGEQVAVDRDGGRRYDSR